MSAVTEKQSLGEKGQLLEFEDKHREFAEISTNKHFPENLGYRKTEVVPNFLDSENKSALILENNHPPHIQN